MMALNNIIVSREFYDFLAGIKSCMKIGEKPSPGEMYVADLFTQVHLDGKEREWGEHEVKEFIKKEREKEFLPLFLKRVTPLLPSHKE